MRRGGAHYYREREFQAAGQRLHRFEHRERVIVFVHPAQIEQDAAFRLLGFCGAGGQRGRTCGGKLVAQQGIAGAGQHAAAGRQQTGVVLAAAVECLVEQQIGIVGAVAQIVDHHQPRAAHRAGGALPHGIERVVVANNPVGALRGNQRRAVGGILLLRYRQPMGVRRGAGNGRRGVFRLTACRIGLEQAAGKTLRPNPIGQMAVQGAADEMHAVAVGFERARERQAAHDVAAADGQRCVGTDKEVHGQSRKQGGADCRAKQAA